jgi:glycosyltransferase involved in cell wall biosynthesis
MIVLIPAYEPDERLTMLVAELRAELPDAHVLIVNDGSGAYFNVIFDHAARLGAEVIGTRDNNGKGAALKQGLAAISSTYAGHTVVCADCDGQHTAEAIRSVVTDLGDNARTLVLGARRFTGEVPARSRLGNSATRALFAFATGRHLADTQTGLRAYSSDLVDWLLNVEGDRFEYEQSVLLRAVADGVTIREVLIETIYHEGNASSHFRPIVDSIQVWRPLIRSVGQRRRTTARSTIRRV